MDLEEDIVMEKHDGAVQSILELFCLLGAGYWRLCQVGIIIIMHNDVSNFYLYRVSSFSFIFAHRFIACLIYSGFFMMLYY